MPSFTHRVVRILLVLLGAVALPVISRAHDESPGSVFTLSNAPDLNRVLVFSRGAQGELKPAGAYPTGGKGTGAALGSQGALALSDDGRWLLAVNAGSDQISVFSVRHDSLVLADVASSGGRQPISITVADNLVYVLNAGGALGASDMISGFYLSEHGQLHALPGSSRPLSGPNVAPAQVSFGSRGDVLLVTEKGTSRIMGFAVDDHGRAGPGTPAPSSGATPFGFAVSSKGYLFVSEAPGSALSSYRLHDNGTIHLISASVANHQKAACWVVLSKDQKYAYTANAASNSISAYRIGADGSVTLVNSDGLTATTDDGPLDLAVSHDGRFLYSLDARARTIVGYRAGHDGALARIGAVSGLPAGSVGLAAR